MSMHVNGESGYQSSNPKATLIVSNLHPHVTEAMLYVAFSDLNQILSIHIPRDVASQSSLGYAYITFATRQDAEHALETLLYEDFMGRELQITWYKGFSSSDFVLVYNLAETFNQSDLQRRFSVFGEIVSCKVAVDERGRSKGCGYVRFKDEMCAKRAIYRTDGYTIRGRIVYAEPLTSRIQYVGAGGESEFTRIVVRNLKERCTEEHLKALFEPFGKIINARVTRSRNSSFESFGLVYFEHPTYAQEAVWRMNCEIIDGKMLHVSYIRPWQEHQEAPRQQPQEHHGEDIANSRASTAVYVAKLDESVSAAQLRRTFEKFGKITHVEVMTGRSKGIGFVRFISPVEAMNAVNWYKHMIGSEALHVILA